MGVDLQGLSMNYIRDTLHSINEMEDGNEQRIRKTTILLYYYNNYLEDIFRYSEKLFEKIRHKCIFYKQKYMFSTNETEKEFVRMCNEIERNYGGIVQKFNYQHKYQESFGSCEKDIETLEMSDIDDDSDDNNDNDDDDSYDFDDETYIVDNDNNLPDEY